MSLNSLENSWKTENFRKSVEDKLNKELAEYPLLKKTYGKYIEDAIFERSQSKQQYLGYVSKIILNIRNMVCIQETWLQSNVKEVLSKPPPKLRRVLKPEELAQYNLEVMRLQNKLQEGSKLRLRKS